MYVCTKKMRLCQLIKPSTSIFSNLSCHSTWPFFIFSLVIWTNLSPHARNVIIVFLTLWVKVTFLFRMVVSFKICQRIAVKLWTIFASLGNRTVKFLESLVCRVGSGWARNPKSPKTWAFRASPMARGPVGQAYFLARPELLSISGHGPENFVKIKK